MNFTNDNFIYTRCMCFITVFDQEYAMARQGTNLTLVGPGFPTELNNVTHLSFSRLQF